MRAHRLLQDQADAPGREQGFERPPIEKADDGALQHDADSRRRREKQREAPPPNRRRATAPAGRCETLLHDEGRIGAEHDHLAMRHVDDAHHAEGDGKPDRRQQQDAAERNPFEQADPDLDELEARRDRGHCRLGRFAQIGILLGDEQRLKLAFDIGIGRARQTIDRGQPAGAIGAAQIDQRERRLDRLTHRGLRLLGQRRGEARGGIGRGLGGDGLRRLNAQLRIRAEQRQLSKHALKHAAQTIIDGDFGQIIGVCHRDRLSGDRVAVKSAILQHQRIVRRGEQSVIRQSLQNRDGARIIEPAEKIHRRDLIVESIAIERGDTRGEIMGCRRRGSSIVRWLIAGIARIVGLRVVTDRSRRGGRVIGAARGRHQHGESREHEDETKNFHHRFPGKGGPCRDRQGPRDCQSLIRRLCKSASCSSRTPKGRSSRRPCPCPRRDIWTPRPRPAPAASSCRPR